MILTLYDLNHNKVAGLKKYKNANVESVLYMGDKTLSFSWHRTNLPSIPLEGYIRTDTDEYVVKENSQDSNGYRKIVARLNLEEVEGMTWEVFRGDELTAQEMADYALSGTGWTCISTVPDRKRRNISLQKVTSYAIFEKIVEAFTCEVSWDSVNKVVHLKEKVGSDKGAYFIKGLNLKELSDSSDSYDFATRLIPIGAGDLYITDVNDGQKYIENYQYSTKIKTVIWEDSNYTDADALKEDAEYKLNEISKPKRTYQAKVYDLAKLKPEYSILEYNIGDTIILIDNEAGIKEKQRITKTVEYIENPEKNTCEISNTVLSFADMQKQLFAAAECIENITTDNGTVKGSTVDSIDVTQIIGLERYISESMDELGVKYLYATLEMQTPLATVGKMTATDASITALSVAQRADIQLEYVEESHITHLYADYFHVAVLEADNLSAVFEKVDNLDAEYAKIDFTNVNTASIATGFLHQLMVDQGIIADRVVAGEVVSTGALTGISIYADDITAGTLSVDRLVLRGTETSLVYALNNSGGLVSTRVDTLDAYLLTDRTVTADKIVAGSITSAEINVGNLIATGFIGTNKLTAANINVNDLFAQNITAAGTIQSSNYEYSSGLFSEKGICLVMSTGQIISKTFAIDNSGDAYFSGTLNATVGHIGGFEIGEEGLFRGCTSIDNTNEGVFIGTNGFRTVAVQIDNTTIGASATHKGAYSYYESFGNDDSRYTVIGASGISCNSVYKNNTSYPVRLMFYLNEEYMLSLDDTGLHSSAKSNIITCDAEAYLNYLNVTGDVLISHLDNTESKVRVLNSLHDGNFTTSVNGNFGIYDNTFSKWIVKCDTSGNVNFYGTANKASNADKLGGYAVSYAGDKDVWGTIPSIGASDGVMEVGKYIDFHTTDGNTADYDVRITATTDYLEFSKRLIVPSVTVGDESLFMGNLKCTATLTVGGRINNTGTTDNVVTNAANVYISSSSNFCKSSSSSKRYKHDIKELDIESIKQLYELPIYTFKYNTGYISPEDERADKDIPGLIVEDLEQILPIAVNHDNGLPEMWNSNILVPCILGLMQDLNSRVNAIEGLQQTVYALQFQLEEAKNKIQQLEKMLAE